MSADLPILIVCNRHSGSGEGWHKAEQLARIFQERGAAQELRETKLDGSTLRDATAGKFRAIVILGGDGSFHAAVNQLPSYELPIAFYGTGTINVLSSAENLPREAAAVADLVLAGKTAAIPVLEGNGRSFVLFGEAGWLGTVVAKVNRWRKEAGKHGKFEFARFGAIQLVKSWGRPLSVKLRTNEGEERSGQYANVLVTRCPVYGGSMKIPMSSAEEAPLRDPCFTVVAERYGNPFGHAMYLAAGTFGFMGMIGQGSIERCLATEIEIDGPPTGCGVHLDAESEGEELRLPLQIRATNQTLQLLVP